MKLNKKLLVTFLGLTMSTSVFASTFNMVSTQEKKDEIDADYVKELKEVKSAEQRVQEMLAETEKQGDVNYLSEEQKLKSIIALERLKTELLAERLRQQELFKEQIEKEVEDNVAIRKVEQKEKSEEEAQNAYKNAEEQALLNYAAQQNILNSVPDDIIVNSVYGLNNKLYGELTINGNKYIVQKGEELVGGYLVENIDKYGLTLSKDGDKRNYVVGKQVERTIQATPINAPTYRTIVPNQF